MNYEVLLGIKGPFWVSLREVLSYATPDIHDLPKMIQVVAELELETVSLAPCSVIWPVGKEHRMTTL